MKYLIVLYSKTGNTLGVAKRLQESLKCDLEEVKAKSDDSYNSKPELINIPDIKDYQHLIFASPVHAFSLSGIMKAYLNQLPDLSGRTVDLFITHQFPFAWLGGNRSLKQMKKIVEYKNGVVRNLTSVNWGSKKRELVIESLLKSYVDEKTV